MNPQNPNRPPYRPDRYGSSNSSNSNDRNSASSGYSSNRYGSSDRGTRPPRPKPSNMLNGLLVVNKPVGPTSHDIVYRIRKWTNERRVGHTGTLDPLASGVLIICLGPATRVSEYLLGSDKKYQAIIRLGQSTDTFDSQGTFTSYADVNLTQEQVESALTKFRGAIMQTPPAFSAIQVNGKRAYEAAREGEPIDLQPREITVHSLELVSWKSPDLVVDVACSAGTYIRSLANDIGKELGTGGHIASLMRTATSHFTLKDAHSLNDIETAFREGKGGALVVPTDRALLDWQEVKLDADGAKKIMHGNPAPITTPVTGTGSGRAYDPQGRLVALVQADTTTNEWKPKKVLITADDSRPYTG